MLDFSTSKTEENLFRVFFLDEGKSLSERKLMLRECLKRLEHFGLARKCDSYQSVVTSIAEQETEVSN
ncbi:hypothetical protein AB6A40_011741 [Gnathostoma spinigerum]|uniref:Uncharacterized protein n=1 Tax=Gnathostoma spinigerum TaxID=75299 RepID=A0ABD6F0I7_9BILA